MAWESVNPVNDGSLGQFDLLLIESIDEVFTTLGEPCKNGIYARLEHNHSMTKHQIAPRIEEFSKILHKIFGLSASLLEIKFIKALHAKTKVNIELPECDLLKWVEGNLTFIEYVTNLKRSFEACNCTTI